MPDLKRLRARARSTFPNPTAELVVSRVRAIVGSERDMPPTEQGRLAAAALRKLEGIEAGDPSPTELAALELMIRMTRPSVLVHSATPDDFTRAEQSEIFASWTGFRTTVHPFMPAIGRLDTAGPSLSASSTAGTGFLVAAGLLMTNRHVLDQLSRGIGALEPGQAVVRFQVEDNRFEEDKPKRVVGVAATHPSLDAVLLQVEDAALAPGQSYPRIVAGDSGDEDIAVAGYPAEISDRNPLFIRSAFANNLGVLRAAPGRITETSPDGFAHDCSTLGGNSGSPVFRMSTSEVIGLHTGGSFLWKNDAVAGAPLAEFVKEKAGTP